jgi:hypothetical protein
MEFERNPSFVEGWKTVPNFYRVSELSGAVEDRIGYVDRLCHCVRATGCLSAFNKVLCSIKYDIDGCDGVAGEGFGLLFKLKELAGRYFAVDG